MHFHNRTAVVIQTLRRATGDGSRMTINGVRIGDIRRQSGFQGFIDDGFSVRFPPLSKNNDDFLVGFREGIRNSPLREDDNGAVDGGPEPENVCVPEKCAALACDCEIVHVALPRLNWTLCNVCRSVSPTGSELPNSMPISN